MNYIVQTNNGSFGFRKTPNMESYFSYSKGPNTAGGHKCYS